MSIISLIYLIAMARTFSTMFIKTGECGHPGLILGLREKAFSL